MVDPRRRQWCEGLAILLAVTAAVGCERSKSANPLSPEIAGPIAGVSISRPTLVTPSANAQIAVDQQPLMLTVQNASTSGVRPLNYTFEVAADSTFQTDIFMKSGVAQGSNGQTSVQLPSALGAEHQYYWRAKAEDGANAGDFTGAAMFNVYTPVVIQAPTPLTPSDGTTLTTLTPTLIVKNADRSGPVGAMSYLFQIAQDVAFTNNAVSTVLPEGADGTRLTLTTNLAYATHYFWRVRAGDPQHIGPWSATLSFTTPAAPTTVGGGGGDSGSGGGGSGGGGSANPNDAFDLSTATVVLGPANIAAWPQTSTVTSTVVQEDNLCIYHTQLGQWPAVAFFGDPTTTVEGNQWVAAYINGHWYAGASDWYRPGQACKDVTRQSIGADGFYNPAWEPLYSWVPAIGEVFAVFSSTPARAWPDMSTLDQRTNVVLVHFVN